MSSARFIALPLALLTGCAALPTTARPTTTARPLPADLQIGAMSQRTAFELDDGAESSASTEDLVVEDDPDTEKKKRRRKLLFTLGVVATGVGLLGWTSFGIGGRVTQAQLSNGYEDGDLTRDREDTLTTRGEVMNGLAISSAVLALIGSAFTATVYGIDHARCGDLPPRRKKCPDRTIEDDDDGGEPSPAPAK